MELLNFREEEKGWWLAIKFHEKGQDRKNIIQAIFFPKIDDERAMKPFFNNHLNTTHNFGEIEIKGFLRFVPQEVKAKISDSLRWVRQMGKETGTYDSRRVEQESLVIFGSNTELVKKYPKTYVKTKSGWVPSLLRGFTQKLEAEEKKIQLEKQFNEEFREGTKNGNVLQVLQKWTVKLETDSPAEKEYQEIIIPVMPGYDESCGDTYKSEQGIYNYGRIAQYMGK